MNSGFANFFRSLTSLDWQTVTALGCVGLAGLALLPRIIGLFRADQKSGCSGCEGCSSNNLKVVQKPLVSIKDIVDRRQ